MEDKNEFKFEKTKSSLFEILESQIDQHGVEFLLETLTDVCFNKGEHVRSNWQDNLLGSAWGSLGKRISAIHVSPVIKK